MSTIIAENRKARHNYQVEQKLEAGIVLEGWEVKSIRAGKVQLAESYVVVQRGEAFLLNSHISPLSTVSTHIEPRPTRTRKLLLSQAELTKLIGGVERKGYTLVPLNLHWKKNLVKVEIALAKGKSLYDKRQTEKERDWQRDKQHLFKSQTR